MSEVQATGRLGSAAPSGLAPGTIALLAAVGCATAAAVTLSKGSFVIAAVPVCAVALLWAITRAPLRWSTTVLLVLILSLDTEEDAQGVWHSPLSALGDLLRYNVDKLFPAIPLKLSGMELLVLFLLCLAVHRKMTRNPIDSAGQEQSAAVLSGAVVVFLLALVYATVNGLTDGGSVKFAIVQVRPLLHIAVMYLLFVLSYRGPRDHALVAKIVLLTACVRSALAVWADRAVRSTPWFSENGPEHWHCPTNHGDSVLFSLACVVLIAHFLERTDRRRLTKAALLLPVIFVGMLVNQRRLAWVDLMLALVCIYAISPWVAWKRFVTRVLLVSAPIALLYVAAGWNSQSVIFKPVRMVRSVSDSNVDRSTLYREIENWNLAKSISESPIMGRGFGHPFTEYIKGDDISSIFELYAIEPHNSVLGLALFGGYVGFTGMWMLLAIGIFLAVRSYRFSSRPEDRAAALCALAAFLVCCIQTFGDMGQFYVQFQIFLALALAVVSKLAITSGAWPRRLRKQGPQAEREIGGAC